MANEPIFWIFEVGEVVAIGLWAGGGLIGAAVGAVSAHNSRRSSTFDADVKPALNDVRKASVEVLDVLRSFRTQDLESVKRNLPSRVAQMGEEELTGFNNALDHAEYTVAEWADSHGVSLNLDADAARELIDEASDELMVLCRQINEQPAAVHSAFVQQSVRAAEGKMSSALAILVTYRADVERKYGGSIASSAIRFFKRRRH